MTVAQRKPKSATATKIAPRDRSRADKQHNDDASIIKILTQWQAVIEFELDGTVVSANDNFLHAVNYTLGEIQGRHHGMFVDEAYRSSPEYKEFWARLNRGEFQAGEYKRFGKGGKEVWLQASYMPIPDASGRPYKVVKFATDITAMVKARADAARITSMVEQLPINVMFADRDLKIRYINPASVKTLKQVEHLLPVKADQMLGQCIDIFHKRPEMQRRLLGDPNNLPHRATSPSATRRLTCWSARCRTKTRITSAPW